MPDKNIGILEQCTPSVGTSTLVHEAILSDYIESVDIEPRKQPLPEPSHQWTQLEDLTSDQNVFIATNQPTWLIMAKYYLRQLANLPEDWDSYGSPPLTYLLLNSAQDFLDSLKFENVPSPFVAPVSGGGIQFEWRNEDRDLEVDFVEPLRVGYLKLIKNEPIEEGDFSSQDYDSALKLIRWLNLGE